jgi:catechol 2,3-dioxygenase-like lactoylglutathione lyase family enzyme
MNYATPITALIVAATSLSFGNLQAEEWGGASHVGCPDITVTSLDHEVLFFKTVLDFKLVGTEDRSKLDQLVPGMAGGTKTRTAHLSLGEECLDLTEYLFPKGAPFPGDSRGNDKWFEHIAIVVSDMDKAYAKLRKARVRFVSNLPQTLPEWNKNAAGISAFYFRDPDGHYLELIHFPPGKGQARWQSPSTALFLGIDHTAIVVSNTAQSVSFYRDKLGFRAVGSSENYGSEQEHLSGVLNAHVLITSLRSESGIGIELLDYLAPDSGRPIPSNMHAYDIAAWQIPIELDAVRNPAEVKALHLRWVKLPPDPTGLREASWTRDPDGHRLELLTK